MRSPFQWVTLRVGIREIVSTGSTWRPKRSSGKVSLFHHSKFARHLTATGLFYSAVAKLLKENPGAASNFKKRTMTRIAKSWKPGQTLTMDHVNLKLPTIEDGVVLYNYVKDGYKQQL